MNRRQISGPTRLKLTRRSLRSSRLGPKFSVQIEPEYSRINQETPTDQLDTPDLTTVDAARELEAAEKANSDVNTVTVPIQSVASALSGTDNPIPLVNWISSFLKTLEKFNGVVDKIATVSFTLCPESPPMLL